MEIKIAVCDDEHQQTEYIKSLVSKWADAKNIKVTIDMFESAEKFKSAWSESKTFDILLLDIEMGGQNGVELARDIRRTDEKLVIIFITGFAEYISEGYDVSALHYLMKPIKADKLFEVLDRAARNLTQINKSIMLNINGEIRRVLLQDLTSVDTVLKTGNVMLDAILNSKLSLAKQRNIEVNAKAAVPDRLQITDVDLCVLIGNLLDNAMEACVKTKDTADSEFDRPFIRVYMGMKGYHLYICVTNSVYGKLKKSGGRFISTKNSPTHGFGLMRIDKVCDKYGGYCKRNSEPGVFSTEILLLAKEK